MSPADNNHLNAPAPANCQLCPRACGANRKAGDRGVCGADAELRIARAALHYWEEPPISGSAGSGTIFFSNCPLACVYCQNQPISHAGFGRNITVERLAEICLELQNQGAHNINLVTATQYTPWVIAAIAAARMNGLTLPVIWNSSGYESADCINLLADTVDAYLIDFRYVTPALAAAYSNAADYPEIAIRALQAALTMAGEYQLDENGLITAGLIVRFLLLPGHLDEAMNCVSKVFELCANKVCYALMNQYTPPENLLQSYPELNARVSESDYDRLIEHTLDLGVTQSFMQEGATAEASFIPAFDLTGVLSFPSPLT